MGRVGRYSYRPDLITLPYLGEHHLENLHSCGGCDSSPVAYQFLAHPPEAHAAQRIVPQGSDL